MNADGLLDVSLIGFGGQIHGGTLISSIISQGCSNQEDNQTSKQNTAEKDVVQPTETKKLPQEVNFKDELSNIKEVLPYLGKDYSIEYIESINIINVKITASSAEEFKEIKKDAENFIKAQGVGDICALNIFWIPQVPQEVRKTINAKTLITTGCPP